MAAFDSTIRLRQLNQPDLSGYIGQVLGAAYNTGLLTGAFYPYATNPNGYITTGQTGVFKTQTDLNSIYFQILSIVAANYYPNTNPYAFTTGTGLTSSILSMQTGCATGVNTQYVPFYLTGSPFTFLMPPKVVCSFQNSIDSNIYGVSIGNVTDNGVSVNYSAPISVSGYNLNIIATT